MVVTAGQADAAQRRPPTVGADRAAATIGGAPRLAGAGRVLGWFLIAGLPVAMFGLFFFYPVGSLIGRGLIRPGPSTCKGWSTYSANHGCSASRCSPFGRPQRPR